MDPGTKIAVIVAGAGLLAGLATWLFRRFVGVPTPDPTAPKGQEGQTGNEGDYAGHDH